MENLLKNSGISPAVGVILLIGITAAVATIAGIVLLDIGENQQQVSAAGVDITETPEGVELTWTDSGTAEQIQVLVDGEQITTLDSVNETATLGVPNDSTVSVVGVSESGDESTIRSEETTSDTTEEGSSETTVRESPGGASTVTGTVSINPEINGAIVQSVDDSGSIIDSTTTDSSGSYTVEASSEDNIQVIVDGFTYNGTDHYMTFSERVPESGELTVDFGEVTTRSVTVNGETINVYLDESSDGFKLIGSVEMLQSIRDNTANYRLISDIDASETSEWNSGSGFEPLFKTPADSLSTVINSEGGLKPSYTNVFTGTFDGNNHTVSGLYIDRSGRVALIADSVQAVIKNIEFVDSTLSGSETVGLIGSSANSDITNIVVENSSVEGDGSAGVLVASLGNYQGSGFTVSDITVSGSTVTSGSKASGVLAGDVVNNSGSTATISNISVDGSVTGKDFTGGLLGRSLSFPVGSGSLIIEDSTASVTVDSSSGKFVGGFVGRATPTTTIKNSKATGDVTGDIEVGGFVGSFEGVIENSRSTGSVSGSEDIGGFVGNLSGEVKRSSTSSSVNSTATDVVAGGFVGYTEDPAVIMDSFATGSVSGEGVSGFVDSNNGQITRSFTTVSLSGSNLSGFAGDNVDGSLTDTYWDTEATGESTTDGSSTGLTTSELQGETASSNLSSFDFDTVWTTTGGYPELQKSD